MKHMLTSGLAAVILGTLALAPMSQADPTQVSLDTIKTLDTKSVSELLKSADIKVGDVIDDVSVEFTTEGVEGVAVLFGDEESDEGPYHELMLQARFENSDVDTDAVNELNTVSRFLRAYVQDDVVYVEWDAAISSGVSTEYLESMVIRFTIAVREAKSYFED
ncbi:MAG: YbjN domain-containing protein [Fimbriimonadaceae bacterium]|nr:YbjN domain-containing protein [Fimbriimonadaceae bacterium]